MLSSTFVLKCFVDAVEVMSQLEITKVVKLYLLYAKLHDAVLRFREHIELKLHLRVEYEIFA